jgi:hypothetical protein
MDYSSVRIGLPQHSDAHDRLLRLRDSVGPCFDRELGCANWYAERMVRRQARVHAPAGGDRRVQLLRLGLISACATAWTAPMLTCNIGRSARARSATP